MQKRDSFFARQLLVLIIDLILKHPRRTKQPYYSREHVSHIKEMLIVDWKAISAIQSFLRLFSNMFLLTDPLLKINKQYTLKSKTASMTCFVCIYWFEYNFRSCLLNQLLALKLEKLWAFYGWNGFYDFMAFGNCVEFCYEQVFGYRNIFCWIILDRSALNYVCIRIFINFYR